MNATDTEENENLTIAVYNSLRARYCNSSRQENVRSARGHNNQGRCSATVYAPGKSRTAFHRILTTFSRKRKKYRARRHRRIQIL